MPSGHRIGRDNDESLFPLWPGSARGGPEEFVERGKLRPGMLAFKHRELLPKRQIFEQEVPTSAEEPEYRTDQ